MFFEQIFVTLLLYLDDLLVFMHSLDEHLERMEIVLKLLQQHGLKLKPSKCHILKPEIHYLESVILERGISTDPEKSELCRSGLPPVKEI